MGVDFEQLLAYIRDTEKYLENKDDAEADTLAVRADALLKSAGWK